MYSNNKQIRDVADVAAQIMSGQQPVTEKLHPNQQKLDVHEPEKDELTADDFKKLRAGKKDEVKKEEVESISEIEEANDFIKGVKRFVAGKKNPSDVRDAHLAKSTFSSDPKVKEKEGRRYDKVQNVISKEEVEQEETILEYEAKSGRYVHKGTYGSTKGAEYGETDYDKENEMAKSLDKKKPKKKAYGARQNFVRSTRVNETFSGLMSVYAQSGLKGLAESLVKEEPTNEKFKKELDAQQKKSETKVEEETVDIELVIDGQNGYDQVQIGERALTDDEAAKKEEIVKSMKKGLSGFKERYGKDAKSVMYATATKQAKGE